MARRKKRTVRRPRRIGGAVLADHCIGRGRGGTGDIRKIAVALSRSKNCGRLRSLVGVGTAVSGPLVGQEKESVVLPNGAAHRSAILILVENRRRHREEIPC